jgi:uncharacterized RDD family membrane protein YckC
MRIMGLRLMTYGGTPPGVWRSSVRLAGLVLAIIPLFLGFVPVLLDARRRALQDYLARTVVVYAESDAGMVVWTTPDGHRTATLPPRPAEQTMRTVHRSTGSPP